MLCGWRASGIAALLAAASCGPAPPFEYELRVTAALGAPPLDSVTFYADQPGPSIELQFEDFDAAQGTVISYIARRGTTVHFGSDTIGRECDDHGLGDITSERVVHALGTDLLGDPHDSYFSCAGEHGNYDTSND